MALPVEDHLFTVERELARGANLSIINLVNSLVKEAHDLRASDIHIDPGPTDTSVRLRIDGVLHPKFTLDKRIHSEVIARIKVLAWLRSDEHQAAQDGRFRHQLSEGHPIDVR